MRSPKLLGIPAALVLLAGCAPPSRSEELALRPGPGFEATRIGQVSFEKRGLVELGKHSLLALGDGRIVYYHYDDDGERGTLGEIDKTLQVRTLAKFEDSQDELRELLAKQEDKPMGGIEFGKVLAWATSMQIAKDRAYLLLEESRRDSMAVRVVQAIEGGKVEWTWFVQEKKSGDESRRQAFDVNEKGTEILLIDMGYGNSFSVYDRKRGRVASYKFAEPREEPEDPGPTKDPEDSGASREKPKLAVAPPAKPQPPVDPNDGLSERLPPDMQELVEAHRRAMAKLEKEKEKEREKSGKKEVPAPAPTKIDWPMNEIEHLRCLPGDTYLVLGRDQDGPSAVWLRKDGTVKAGVKRNQLGRDYDFAGLFRGNPVFLDKRELTMRVVGPDLVANEITGLRLEERGAGVMGLDADTLLLDRGRDRTWVLFSIEKTDKKK